MDIRYTERLRSKEGRSSGSQVQRKIMGGFWDARKISKSSWVEWSESSRHHEEKNERTNKLYTFETFLRARRLRNLPWLVLLNAKFLFECIFYAVPFSVKTSRHAIAIAKPTKQFFATAFGILYLKKKNYPPPPPSPFNSTIYAVASKKLLLLTKSAKKNFIAFLTARLTSWYFLTLGVPKSKNQYTQICILPQGFLAIVVNATGNFVSWREWYMRWQFSIITSQTQIQCRRY